MMRFSRLFLALLCLMNASFSETLPQLKINSHLAQVTSSCKKLKTPAKNVYFFKQWHLEPGLDSKKKPGPYPQSRNLESIFLQLDSWIKRGQIKTVIAEGCAGTIDHASSFRVNGWTVADLESEKSKSEFQKIATSVPLKLEAKYGTTLITSCGDTEELVKQQLRAFSDARGEAGYLSRLIQYKSDPAKAAPYLKDAIALFNLPASATPGDAIQALQRDLKLKVTDIQTTIDQRNRHLVEVIAESPEKTIAVVYGGMHADGVRGLLEEKGFACQIIEPSGYQNNEADLVKQLDSAVGI